MEGNGLGELAGALAKAQAAFPKVKKDREARITSPSGKFSPYTYKYADLATLIEAVRKPLADNGLAYTQTMDLTERGLLLVTTLRHDGGGQVASYYPLRDHERPQDMGSEITYARRYALSAMLGVASEEDDDGAAAQQAEPTGPPQPPIPRGAPKVTKPQGGGMEPATDEQADKEFPKYDPETEERKDLIKEARRLADKVGLSPKDRQQAMHTYLGGKDVQSADLASLADLVKWLRTRANE